MKNNHILPFLWLHGEDEATLRDMLQKIAQSNIGAAVSYTHLDVYKRQGQHVHELGPAHGRVHERRGVQTRQRLTGELEQNKHARQSQQEGRTAHSDESEELEEVVEAGILVSSGNDTHGDGDGPGNNQGQKRDADGGGQTLLQQRQNGLIPLEGASKVKLCNNVLHPIQILSLIHI